MRDSRLVEPVVLEPVEAIYQLSYDVYTHRSSPGHHSSNMKIHFEVCSVSCKVTMLV